VAISVPDLVVVGVDGSADSLAALRWAFRHVPAAGTVRVVHVWSAVPGFSDLPEYRRSQLEADRARTVDDATRLVTDALREIPPTRCRTEGMIIEGAPGQMLVEIANHADLLVVGATGSGGGPLKGKTSIGSVARYVTRQADCPVTVVPVGRRVEPSLILRHLKATVDISVH
jgi:nucleotide-binding universal stress UspA family protein